MAQTRTEAQIERAFKTYDLDDHQTDDVNEIRTECKALAISMSRHAPESRELSLALTALEEACMWAVKAIAQRPK